MVTWQAGLFMPFGTVRLVSYYFFVVVFMEVVLHNGFSRLEI